MGDEATKKITEEVRAAFEAFLEKAETKEVIEVSQKAADASVGTFEVVITTENVDRYGEVIKLDGWDTDHYMKNPVVLWGHSHFTLPIGVCTSLVASDGKLIAKGKFAPHAHAQEIRALYDMGIVRATSVGFIVKEQEGNLITKSELIEFSFVSVPANPYALALAMEKGQSIDALVTKGIFRVETKDAETVSVTVPQEQPVVLSEESAVKIADLVIEKLKPVQVASALEDTAKGDEPEGTEGEPVVETEDAKQLREFSEKRRTLQEAATIIGDVLAVSRQAIEAQK